MNHRPRFAFLALVVAPLLATACGDATIVVGSRFPRDDSDHRGATVTIVTEDGLRPDDTTRRH